VKRKIDLKVVVKVLKGDYGPRDIGKKPSI